MNQSIPFQAMLEGGEALAEALGEARGEIKGIRRVLLHVGEIRFGCPPGARVKEAVEAILDAEALLELVQRLLDVRSWEELLPRAPQNTPARRRKRRP